MGPGNEARRSQLRVTRLPAMRCVYVHVCVWEEMVGGTAVGGWWEEIVGG